MFTLVVMRITEEVFFIGVIFLCIKWHESNKFLILVLLLKKGPHVRRYSKH